MDPPHHHGRAAAGIAFLALAALWVGLRFVPVAGAPDAAALSAIESVRVIPSSETGRLEIVGEAGAAAARATLQARVAAIHSRLGRQADRLAGRLDEFDDGTVALRLAGLAVPFHDHDARRLAAVRGPAAEKPWLALQVISDVIAARLEEPPQSIEVESTVRRRELTRTFREIQDAMSAAEADARGAQEEYRAHALAAIQPRSDSFRREGRGRLAEAWLAAWLAVSLHGWRRPRGVLSLAVGAAAAAVAAVGALLALEGSPLLPVDPGGVTPAFLPLSFAIGWAVAALVGRSAAGETTRPEATATRDAPAPAAEAPSGLPAAGGHPPPPAGPLPSEKDPQLREITRDLLAPRAARRRAAPPAQPQAPRSEVEVEEDPVVGPGRRAFGPPPRTAEPPPGTAPQDAPPERLPFFRRRRS